MDKQIRSDKKPSNPKEWRVWKEEHKAFKRRKGEEKLMRKLEKEHKQKKKLVEETDKKTEAMDTCDGRNYTVSIALPGSVMDNAQTPELKTYLAGQIARAVVVFNVDEVIIFDETGEKVADMNAVTSGRGYCNIQLAHLLQYLECPQYLRKRFFPIHRNLQHVGLLNPLDCPSHVKEEEWSSYREGVVLQKPTKDGRGSFVYVGLKKEVQVDKKLDPGMRVTVEMMKEQADGKKLKGKVVNQSTPVEKCGTYWGYTVRLAARLADVFANCPYAEGYDVKVGTSEKGDNVDLFKIPTFKHLLIVFGGVQGLECSIDIDDVLDVDDPAKLFDHYLNTCPNQGSGIIRTEEAIPITLATLRAQIDTNKPTC